MIIFGATGAVGQHVARAAVHKEHEVTLYVRSRARLEGLLPADVLQKCKVGGMSVTSPAAPRLQQLAVLRHGSAHHLAFEDRSLRGMPRMWRQSKVQCEATAQR